LRVEKFDNINIFDYHTKGGFFHPSFSRMDNSGGFTGIYPTYY